MRCLVKIEDIHTIKEIDGVWSDEDFIELLDRMDFPDAQNIAKEELREMLYMAMTDFEPDEAAEIILDYKFSDVLSKGQIQNLAHEMIDDSVTEEYADISLHYQLFNINRLLYNAYNGKFPNTKATVLKLKIEFQQNAKLEINKEIVLKAVSKGLNDNNLIRRLFSEQLNGEVEFVEADHIIWDLELSNDGLITIITSDYWLNEEDFLSNEFNGTIIEFDKEED